MTRRMEDYWYRHALNYVIKESGIRDFCSKCADCCLVCEPRKRGHGAVPEGCRNSVCIQWFCGSLRELLRGTKVMVLLCELMRKSQLKKNKMKECNLADIKETIIKYGKQTKEILDNFNNDVYTGKQFTLGNMSHLAGLILKPEDCRKKVCMTNVKLAKKFDVKTDRIFARISL